MSIPSEVHGTSVSLLPCTEADVTPDYVVWLNDREVMRFTESRHEAHSLASAREYVSAAENDPKIVLWRIMKDDVHIGNIRLSAISRHHERCEIAIIIGMKGEWGSGTGPAAIDLASRYAFTTLGLRKVSALIYADNKRSVGAFKKAGFQDEARLKAHFLADGRSMDGLWLCRFAEG